MRTVQYFLVILVTTAAAMATAGPVNINTADAETIASELTGIGLSKARAIVAFREANGPFTDVAQLADVKGVGVKLIERNLDDVRLKDAP